MEGYLRLILLVMGGVIVFFILLEAWFSKRRQLKLANLSANYSSQLNLNPDEVVEFGPREPQHRITALHVQDEDGHEVVLRTASPVVEKVAVAEKSGLKVAVMDDARPAAASRRDTNVKPQTKPSAPAPDFTNDLLVLSVVAQPGQQFVSYELMQAISGTGMQFGEMNIFHYYYSTPQGRRPLFSLASATEPGEFNMDRIGELTCTGLTMFMQLGMVPNPQQAFDLMLKTAEQLADDLNGELRAGPRKPLTDEIFDQYQQKVTHYQLKKRA